VRPDKPPVRARVQRRAQRPLLLVVREDVEVDDVLIEELALRSRVGLVGDVDGVRFLVRRNGPCEIGCEELTTAPGGGPRGVTVARAAPAAVSATATTADNRQITS
jgi:hypothetical protein